MLESLFRLLSRSLSFVADISQILSNIFGDFKDTDYDAVRNWFTLAVFLLSSLLCINPTSIRCPRFVKSVGVFLLTWLHIASCTTLSDSDWYFPLNLTTAPLFGSFLLLLTGSAGFGIIREIFTRHSSFNPVSILLYFLGLSYICLAFERAGALEEGATRFLRLAGSSGKRLYFFVFIFFFLASMLLGNDAAVLCGANFMLYFVRASGAEEEIRVRTQDATLAHQPWLVAQFVASNIGSAVFVSGNPTNVLLSGAFQLSAFRSYTRIMLLPSLVPTIVVFPLLLFLYRSTIPPVIRLPSSRELRDKAGAQFHGTVLGISITLILVTGPVLPGSWGLIVPAALVSICRDLIHDFRKSATSQNPPLPSSTVLPPAFNASIELATRSASTAQASLGSADSPVPMESAPVANVALPDVARIRDRATLSSNRSDAFAVEVQRHSGTPTPFITPEEEILNPMETIAVSHTGSTHESRYTVVNALKQLQGRFRLTSWILSRLPYPLIFFAFGDLILVTALAKAGWTAHLARQLSHVTHSPAQTVFVMALLGSALNCLSTNVTAVILLVEVIGDPNLVQGLTPPKAERIVRLAVYATALSANVGAFGLSFNSSFAGLMWARALEYRHRRVPWSGFVQTTFVPFIAHLAIGSAIILAIVR